MEFCGHANAQWFYVLARVVMCRFLAVSLADLRGTEDMDYWLFGINSLIDGLS